MAEAKQSKSQPVFALSENMIKHVIKNESMTVLHIGALLTVAHHTGSDGIYSSVGAYGVRNRLHISDRRAGLVLEDLRGRGFIKMPTDFHPNTNIRKNMPMREGRGAVRWIIEPDESRNIWFPASLVTGYGKWRDPLHDLRRNTGICARLLLAFYLFENVVDYGGIDPTTAIFRKCEVEKTEVTYIGEDRIYMHIVDRVESPTSWFNFWSDYLGVEIEVKNGNHHLPQYCWDALNKLIQAGFIYECLTVFTGTEVTSDGYMQMVYPLHSFNRYRKPPKGEESLAGLTAGHAMASGGSIADGEGKFDGHRFAFFSDDEDCQLVGIFRLRFRDTSHKNINGQMGWKDIQASRDQWEKRLKGQS